jgi:hypothetical protein
MDNVHSLTITLVRDGVREATQLLWSNKADAVANHKKMIDEINTNSIVYIEDEFAMSFAFDPSYFLSSYLTDARSKILVDIEWSNLLKRINPENEPRSTLNAELAEEIMTKWNEYGPPSNGGNDGE